MSVVALACVTMTLASAGSSHATPAQAAPTLRLIRDMVAREGQISYTSTTHNSADNATWVNRYTVEASAVSMDLPGCVLSFHWHTTVDEKPSQDLDSSITMAMVVSADVIDMETDVRRLNGENGHGSYDSKFAPSIAVVRVAKNNGHTNTLDFRDYAQANRVARAIEKAAALCAN